MRLKSPTADRTPWTRWRIMRCTRRIHWVVEVMLVRAIQWRVARAGTLVLLVLASVMACGGLWQQMFPVPSWMSWPSVRLYESR